MDEELGGVNPNSFFDQATETREMAETAQKTSNSNLSLLNELKERVRKIEIKLFDEEDKRQKEEMEAKVKEQNEKSQGSGGGSKEGGEDGGGTKGGGGGVMGFISSFIGGLVGGTVGLAVQGAGAIIGLGTGLIKKGADLAKSLRKGLSNLFGGKKNEEGGEVNPKVHANSLMDLKIDDKNVRVSGVKNRGREGDNFSGDQQRNERGEYASKNKDGSSTEVKSKESLNKDGSSTEESFSTSIKYSVKGGEVDPNSLEPGVPLERAQQHFYKSKISELQFEIRNEKLEFGDDANTSSMEEELKKFQKKYNDTLEFGGYDLEDGKTDKKPNEKKRNKFLGLFNEGGLVQKFDQGGEVDSVPAMLTPGEFIVTKDAVQKVGVDTLKGLNASVGDTSKPELSSLEIGFGGGDMSPFEKKQTSVGGLDSSFMIDGEKQYLTPSQIKKQLTKMNVPYKELLNGMVIPDAAKIAAAEVPKWYDTTRQVINETVPDGKMREQMVNELDKFMKNFTGSGGDFRDTSQIEAEMNRYIPGTIENLGLQIGDEAKSKYNKSKKNQSFGNVAQNFNEGGLVTPINESVSPSNKTELELIDAISQSVTNNSQSINIINQQNAAMDKPNNQPAPLTPKTPPNVSEAEVKDTTSPIPFVNLLRLNSQRYLNLGNNAMVIS